MIRRALIRCALAFAAALPLMLPETAEAQRNCRQIEARLASTGGSAQARRFDAAIRAQEGQISKAQGQLRSAGCGGVFSAMRGQCSAIKGSLSRMERNLAELRSTRARLAGGGVGAERRRIEAALNEAGCRGQAAAPRTARAAPAAPARQAAATAPTRRAPARASGNLRTMCVRTCDGYFFPVAWSSSRADFDRDARACAAMCPGAAVELHYHRLPGQESDEMVSAVSGRPYSQMPNAFRYRDASYSRPESCGCERAQGFTVIAGDYSADAPHEGSARQAREAAARDPAADPESRANMAGGLDAAALAALLAQQEQHAAAGAAQPGPAAGERRVRVVGPVFLPDPEGAGDPRARDPRQAR